MSKLLDTVQQNYKNYKEKDFEAVEKSIEIIKEYFMSRAEKYSDCNCKYSFKENNFNLSKEKLKECSNKIRKYFIENGFNVVQKKSYDLLIITYDESSKGEFVESLLDMQAKNYSGYFYNECSSIFDMIEKIIKQIEKDSKFGFNFIEIKNTFYGYFIFKYFKSLGFEVTFQYYYFWDRVLSFFKKDKFFNNCANMNLKISW